MSVKTMTRVWDFSKQEGSRLLVLLAIADHADDDGVAWPGLNKVAEKARLLRRQTITVVKELEWRGEIYVKRGQGRGHTSLYLIVTGRTAEEIETTLAQHEKLQLGPLEAKQAAADILEKQKGATGLHLLRGIKGAVENSVSPRTFSRKGAVQRTKKVQSSVVSKADPPDSHQQDSTPNHHRTITKNTNTKILKAKKAPPPTEVKDLMALMLFGSKDLIGSSWARIVQVWNQLECPPLAKIETWRRWWFREDWRGKKGQRPTPGQLVSEWDKAFGSNDGRVNGDEGRSATPGLARAGKGIPPAKGLPCGTCGREQPNGNCPVCGEWAADSSGRYAPGGPLYAPQYTSKRLPAVPGHGLRDDQRSG